MKNSNPETDSQSYSELLKDPRWKKKREEIIKRDSGRCRLCGNPGHNSNGYSPNDLHVHHILYEDNTNPWDYDENYLITVCEFCHNRIHLQLAENSYLKERCRFIEDDLVYRTIRYLSNSYPKFIYDFNQLTDGQKTFIMSKLLYLMNEIFRPQSDDPFTERI